VNIAVITNINKLHGGEIQSIKGVGLPVYDFKDCDKIKADLVIVLSGGQEQELMIKHLPKLNSIIAWWMCDFREPEHFSSYLDGVCDYMFVPYLNYHKGFSRLAKNGVSYLPQCGFSWSDYDVNINDVQTIFIGNTMSNKYHYNRESILKVIGANSNLSVISTGTTTVEQSSFYAKVPLSISISADEIIGGCSNRLYNIVKAGGCAFVKYFEGLENMFENHKHLIWFKDVKEIPELLNHYLNNVHLIDEIKKNAKLEADKNHSIESRINKIIKTINE